MSRSFRVGLFVIGTLAILVGGVFLIGGKRFLFSHTYPLQVEFPDAAGLNEGAAVRVAGIHQGTVRNIQLPPKPDAKVVVLMDMRPGTRSVIRKDSVATIYAEGLIGDKYIEISPGSAGAPPLRDWDRLQGEPPLEISDLLKKANGILDSAQGAVQSAEEATTHLSAIASKINEGQGTVGALINDKTTIQKINAGATAFQEDMEALKHNFFLKGFFKNRGYEDSTELTRYAVDRLPSGPELKRFRLDGKRLFGKEDTAKLKNEKELQEAGQYLESTRFGLAVVTGYSGLRGDARKNRELTQARTMVVRQYLAKNFRADDTRIRTLGRGEAPEGTDGGTIEIVVYPEAKKK